MNYMKPCPLCNHNLGEIVRKVNNVGVCQCSSCGFVYANLSDKLIVQTNSKYNEAAFTYYESSQTLIDRTWRQYIFKKISTYHEHGRILDVGCGNGNLLSIFKAANWECYGVDISPWGAIAAQKYGFNFYHGALGDAPYPENFFDAVVCTSTLEHLSQPVTFLKVIKRILKPASILYLSGIPNYRSLTVALGVHSFEHNQPPDCANYFTPHTLQVALYKAGFTDYRIRSYGIPDAFYLYNRLVKLFRKRSPLQHKWTDTEGSHSKQESKHTLGASKIACFLYYNLCLPNMGDKLEAIVID